MNGVRKPKVLFTGNILAKHKSSKGISEKLLSRLQDELDIKAVSTKLNRVARFFDIATTTLFTSYDKIVADTYSGWAFIIAISAAFGARIRGKKLVLVLRGGRLPEFYQKRKGLMRFVFQGAYKIVTPSLYLKGFFESQGFQVEYLPNFIDTEVFHEQAIPRKPRSILWIRAFSEIYNPLLAVQTLNEIVKTFPDATLTMIGPDDGMLEKTRNTARQLGLLDKIEFLGPVANSKLPAYFSSHAVYLNTTSYESFGMAVLEAIACGIPVVSTNVGELPLLWLENEEILFCEGFEAASMAGKVEELFADTNKAKRLAENGKKKALSFSWELVRNRWLSLLSSH